MNQNILGWKSKVLSRAGRVALIHSVLNSYHVLWTAAFSLPLQVIDKMERLFRDFLWSGAYLKKTMGRVEWETVLGYSSDQRYPHCSLHETSLEFLLQTKRTLFWKKKMGKNEVRNRNFWMINPASPSIHQIRISSMHGKKPNLISYF